MPALSWWIYVVGCPLSMGALLTLLSLGGKSSKSSKSGARAPKLVKMAKGPGRKTGAKVVKTTGKKPRTGPELPPLFLLQCWLLLWSFLAFVATPAQPWKLAVPLLLMLLAGMAIGSLCLLGVAALVFLRVTPADASAATLRGSLEGRLGESDSKIDERRGSALVRDEYGTLHHVAARSDVPIASGQAVLLLDYDGKNDVFLVRTWSE